MQKSSTKKLFLLSTLSILLFAAIYVFAKPKETNDDKFVTYVLDLSTHNFKLYWKDEKGRHFCSIQRLKDWLEAHDKKLIFAMNAGMYKEDNSALGLFIQDRKIIEPLNTKKGEGNFYLKPNGVFYTTVNNEAFICKTEKYKDIKNVKFATQSGPMLLIDGKVHPAFKRGSENLNIRNGVGILPNKKVFFAMSKQEINLYDFAMFFKEKGCANALYLDGAVSRTYLPEKNWVQTDGNFGVIIGVTK